jgi:hypothetical protein
VLIGIYHFFAMGGIVLIALGAANLSSNDPDVNRHEELTLLKIGIIILLFCYIMLVVWTVSSFGGNPSISDAPGYPGGTTVWPLLLFSCHSFHSILQNRANILTAPPRSPLDPSIHPRPPDLQHHLHLHPKARVEPLPRKARHQNRNEFPP